MFMKMNRRFQGVPEAWTQGMPQHFWDAPALPGLGEQQPGITQQRTPVLPYDMPPNVAQIQPQAPDLSYLNQPLSRAEKIQEVEAAMGRARAAMPPPSYEMLRKSTLNPNNEAVMRMLRDQGGAEYQNYIAEGGTLDDLRRKSRQMVLEREFTTRFPEGRMGGPGSVGGPYGTVRGGPKLRQAQELRGIRRGRVTPEEVRVRRQMRGAPDLSLEDLSAFVPPELKARRDYMQNLANAPRLSYGGMSYMPPGQQVEGLTYPSKGGPPSVRTGRTPGTEFSPQFLKDVQDIEALIRQGGSDNDKAYNFLATQYPQHDDWLKQFFLRLTMEERRGMAAANAQFLRSWEEKGLGK